jgi:hypothetical protein
MEKSESGHPIYRYGEREKDFEFAAGDLENIDRITDHIERHIGPIKTVYHELISDLVHIDVHMVEPTPQRNYYTLVTSGMSDRPMKVPEGCDEYRFAELMISLPPDWPMAEEAWKEEAYYWPVRLLKILARFPHEYDTWLGPMHTVPNGNPPAPFANNTKLCGAILLPGVTVPPGFHRLEAPGRTILFHSVIPLHANEMEQKLKVGGEALFEGFDRHDVSEVLDPFRPSSLIDIPRKKWWQFGR